MNFFVFIILLLGAAFSAFAQEAEEALQEVNRSLAVEQAFIKTGDPMEKDLEGAVRPEKPGIDVRALEEASDLPEAEVENTGENSRRTIQGDQAP